MPSCVVPTCKNTSGRVTKTSGITFHLFPNDPAQNARWTITIRKIRMDDLWKPSKSSVICSVHFKDTDLYETKGGLRRVRKGTVPEKVIFAPSSSVDLSPEQASAETLAGTETNTANDEVPGGVETPLGSWSPGSIADTPRKVHLKLQIRKISHTSQNRARRLKTLQQKHRRLIKKAESLKTIIRNLKSNRYVTDDVYNLLSTNVTAADICNSIHKKTKQNKKRPKYTLALKKFSLTLNFYSPAAYKYVRNTFDTCLPHPKTLAKWYTNINAEPGFTEDAFQALKNKADSSKKKIMCALIVDEMSIRQQSIWDGKRNQGYVDMGTGVREDCKTLASESYVFLLNAVNEHWKIPVGYFFVHGVNAEQKVNLIKLCLTKCYDAGIQVTSLTFDGHSTNVTAMQLLGCKLDNTHELKTTFPHPSDQSNIAVFLDPCHMFKLIRNHFEAKQCIGDDTGVVDWGIIKELNRVQENEGVHIANKLTRKHIMFRNNIMKVKLASQLFSSSVATAIKFCREEVKLPAFKNSGATEAFIQNMNDLFDVFNSRTIKQFDYRRPMYRGNKQTIMQFLDRMENYIHSLKIKVTTKRRIVQNNKKVLVKLKSYKPILECQCNTGFLGILICIQSLKSIYERLVERERSLAFVPMYKVSQDHIELLFGTIRMHGGHNDNPNAKQFKGVYRKLLCHLELKASDTGNCVPLENIGILNCTSAVKSINSSAFSFRHEDSEDQEDSELIEGNGGSVCNLLNTQMPVLHDLSKYIVGYVSGSVVHYLSKSLKCSHCISAMTASDVLWFHKLIGLKNRGGLCYPSQDVYAVCSICESVVRNMSQQKIVIASNRQRLQLVSSILKKFIGNEQVFSTDPDHINGLGHRVNLIRAVIEKYVDIRLHHNAKCESMLSNCYSKRQYYRKLVQQKGN